MCTQWSFQEARRELVVCVILFFVCLCYLRQDFSVQPWLSRNSLCKPGWSGIQEIYLCLRGVCATSVLLGTLSLLLKIHF